MNNSNDIFRGIFTKKWSGLENKINDGVDAYVCITSKNCIRLGINTQPFEQVAVPFGDNFRI